MKYDLGPSFRCSLLILASTLVCCSSEKFILKSEPLAADVFVVDQTTHEKKEVGKTPIDMPLADLRKAMGPKFSSGEFLTLSVEKAGFLPETLSIPVSQFGTSVTKIEVKMKNGTVKKESRTAKEVLQSLFVAQKFAVQQQYERAQIEIDKALAVFPDLSEALAMKGAIYYAQKNYGESLKWYEEALRADPQSEEAIKMVSKVRGIQGLPAASGTLTQGTTEESKK